MPVTQDPVEFLLSVMADRAAATRWRLMAAKAALPYVREPLARGGKKAAQQEAARRASKGRFAPQRAPVFRMTDFKPTKEEA